MIDYRTYRLSNGLTLLTHEAWDTPLASVNMLYAVGSRDEDPSRTGFAHLFEHLMFGGTPTYPNFDAVLSAVGGDNNATTTNDFTQYYATLPNEYLDTILALEQDRIEHLDVSPQALQVQQKVVTEEYHQRHGNAPYGDVWLLLRPLCYKAHPYRWHAIGADIRHVSEATLDDVRAFHRKHYLPTNAILSIAAPQSHEEMRTRVEKAWGCTSAPATSLPSYNRHALPIEPEQTDARELTVHRHVPASALYLAYPMPCRTHPLFHACDLLTDLLGSGKSSRLYRRLVQEQELFIEADAYITGDCDEGLLIISGKLKEGISPEQGLEALRHEAALLANEAVSSYELSKCQNRYENHFLLSQYKAIDRAMALGYYTFISDTSLINREPDLYRAVTPQQLQEAARIVFQAQHENILFYLKG